MSHSIPVSSRNGAQAAFSPATTSNCSRSRSGDSPRATVSRGEWSVRTVHSCPSRAAAHPISSIGLPPSDQSECVSQSPRSSARSSAPAPDVTGAPASSSSFRRYPGTSPASASRTT
jgi:hypothetical protein